MDFFIHFIIKKAIYCFCKASGNAARNFLKFLELIFFLLQTQVRLNKSDNNHYMRI